MRVSVVLLVTIQICMICRTYANECPRRESKLVRTQIKKKILPFYQEANAAIPEDCPLAPPRDIYGYQEDNKYEEASNKWVCEFCGKSFYEERFLDLHLNNRHPNTIRTGPKVVCLANLCDIFRCDTLFMHGPGTTDFWDRALCKETTLSVHRDSCLKLADQCTPKDLDPELQREIFSYVNNTLCAFLTCDNYWENPDRPVSPLSIVYYIVAGMVLLMGMFVYYILLKSQLNQEAEKMQETQQTNHNVPSNSMYVTANQHLRNRRL